MALGRGGEARGDLAVRSDDKGVLDGSNGVFARPGLLEAIQAAAADAAAAGVPMHLTSGWRSSRYQQSLLDEAVSTRGAEDARRWVAGPTDSRHVTGDAVDIGPTDAADWLIRRGAAYGLCQTYANEMWHFELATAPGGICPPPVADAASR